MDESRVVEQGLYDGHVPLDEALARLPMSRRQKLELWLILAVITVVRPVFNFYRRVRGRQFDISSDLSTHTGLRNSARGPRRQGTDGANYLRESDVAAYESEGVLGPFPVLTAAEAAELRSFLYSLHEQNWNGHSLLGQEAVEALKRNGVWSINHGGIFQGIAVPQIRAVAQRPEISQRLASLLGDEVIAWRTQLFELKPDAVGTFWHAATTFTEDGEEPALSEPPGVAPGMINVSLWLALEDVGPSNGCLQFVKGSFGDARFDEIIRRIQKDRVGFLMSLGRDDRRKAITALRFSSNIFHGAQLAFDVALESVPSLYDDCQPAAYPMRAGEAILFSSNNLHGSYGNSSDQPRLAFGVRYTSADVEVYEGQDTIPYNTGDGATPVPTAPLVPIPIHHATGPVIDLTDAHMASQETADDAADLETETADRPSRQ